MEKSKAKEPELNFFAKWAKFFIEKYRITIIFLLVLIGLGVFSVQSNQKQDFPSIPINLIFIQATYPGASPEAVAAEVIQPIESEIKGNDQVLKINSTAAPSFANINVEIDTLNEEVIEKTISEFQTGIDSIQLPDEVDANVFTQNAAGPALIFTLSSETESFNKVLERASGVKDHLEGSSDEIKEVTILPDDSFEVDISLNVSQLNASQLSYQEVSNIIQGNLSVLPGGEVKTDDNGVSKQISITKPSLNIEEISAIQITPDLTIGDIATVERLPEQEDSINVAGFKDNEGTPKFDDEVIYLLVFKEDDGDVLRIESAVNEAVDNIYDENVIPQSIEVNEIFDSSIYVKNQINSLLSSGVIGLLFIIIVFMFFIDTRTGIVVSLIIPIAFLITLFVLELIGFSINVLTLFAMILTLGILVDNAIVVAEGILHRLHKYGESKKQAAIRAVRDLGPAVTAATATTIVVFIPFANLGGVIGEFMKYIPFTIIIMLITSYILAISVTPLFASWIMKEETEEDKREKKLTSKQKILVIPAIIYYGQRFIDSIVNLYADISRNLYRGAKGWVTKGIVIVVTTVAFFISTGVIATSIPAAQFPITDVSQFSVSITLPTGTSTDTEKEIYTDLVKEATELKYFESAFIFQGNLTILITEPVDRADDHDTTVFTLVEDYEEEIQYIKDKAPEGTFIQAEVAQNGPPSDAFDVTVNVKSSDNEAVKNLLDDLTGFVEQGGYSIRRINNELDSNKVPSVEVNFDQDKINELGVTPLTASQIINTRFSSNEVAKTTVREDSVQDDVVLQFNEESRDSINELRNLTVPTNNGSVVQLSDIATIEEIEKAESIQFIDGDRSVAYKIALEVDEEERSQKAGELEKDIQDFLDEEKLAEYNLDEEDITYGGFASDLQGDMGNLAVIFVLAIVMVYLILVFQFSSYIQPLLIMMAIPLSFIGVFPAVKLAGSSLDFISGLGIIALVGIVVNDAIVFIDYYNRQRAKHPDWSIGETLVYTGKIRFKPIFSTSITTIGGVLPLTVQDPFWRGLGAALIGGLIFATIGNLVLLPIMIYIVEFKKKLFGKILGKIRKKEGKMEKVELDIKE